jgi:hypothetical protein
MTRQNSKIQGTVAQNLGNKLLRLLLLSIAALYFSVILLDRFKRSWANALFPPVAVFFAQISGLFPTAATASVEYRAEGWLCAEQRFVELDMDPLFPMLADNKESRFHRVLFFFRRERLVLQALDSFIVRKYPTVIPGTAPDRIGGVRLLSLRIPIPADRSEVTRYRRGPLAEYPPEQRKVWYRTPADLRRQRCGEE